MPRFHQLFLLARASGQREPQQWAQYCHELLLSQQQRLLKDGVPITDDGEMLQHLVEQATAFNTERLPSLIALGIA